MMEAMEFMAAPFCMAVLLVGIHAYLGMHVLEREVIFVDISLSQVAALGGALSLFFAHEDVWLGLSLSLGLCLVAALALSILKHFEREISQEALIGMTYAFASAALILVADKLPHGAEHLKEALVGNILFVTWHQVQQTLMIYAVVGIVHWIWRKKFWAATRGESGAFWWDFLFYFLFGVVITFSTRHAGVLVVFSILVAPAALANRFSDSLKGRLGLAWLIGVASLSLAFIISYQLDLPAGATIVCTLTSLFFAVLLIEQVRRRFLS